MDGFGQIACAFRESLKEHWGNCFGINMAEEAPPSTPTADVLEVAKSAILKNDHGSCSGWPGNYP